MATQLITLIDTPRKEQKYCDHNISIYIYHALKMKEIKSKEGLDPPEKAKQQQNL